MYAAKNPPEEELMNRNQVAVLNFLNALKQYYPDLSNLVEFIKGNNTKDQIGGMAFIAICIPSLAATWKNQAKQAAILLQEVNHG